MPMVRVLERLGQEVRALGAPIEAQWTVVGGRNAANGQLARKRGLDRKDFLDAMATMWSELDPEE